MNKFKVGDKVRVREDANAIKEIRGQMAIVKELDDDRKTYWVHADNGWSAWISEKDLESIEPAEEPKLRSQYFFRLRLGTQDYMFDSADELIDFLEYLKNIAIDRTRR